MTEQNKLYGLFHATNDSLNARFISASNDTRKLTESIPTVNTWTVKRDPNDKTLRMLHESGDENGNVYLVREILYIC